ncbi:class A beta-lactamase [Komagataeibacter sp. FNDCR1]|nr:class A beta-lactamase [Komagataeibacter sp. FNDCR1]
MRRRDFMSCGSAAMLFPAFARAAVPSILSDYEHATGGHVGVYAHNIATGRRLLWRANKRFVMCSTFKASLAACVLSHVDQGRDGLDHIIPLTAADIQDWYAPVAKAALAQGRAGLSVGDMCEGAVEQSDNSCATLLLSRIGGPSALTAFWRAMGDTTTRLDDPEPYLNRTPAGGVRDTTTPASMAAIIQKLVLGTVLSAPSRALLTRWLVGCQTGKNRLRAGLPANWVVGDKTGNNARDAAGDIAVAWPRPDTPIVMCVYTRGGTPTEQQFAAVFSGIGRLVAQTL